jgi:hypothetical protein
VAYDNSYFWGPYHRWFVDLGYPLLDIVRYEDGEWAIIEAFTPPVIPFLTKWHVILSGMKHIEISRGFVEKFVRKIDNKLKQFWDDQERKTIEAAERAAAQERHTEDSAAIAHQAVTRNPDLMCRIAEKGFQEMDLENLRARIPNQRF